MGTGIKTYSNGAVCVNMERIYKYPRTRHLEGSREQAGDEDLKTVKLAELQGKYLVLEEKVDGAN